jgi:hypothetical protein
LPAFAGAGVAILEKLDKILRQKQPILRLKMSLLVELHAAILRLKMSADII